MPKLISLSIPTLKLLLHKKSNVSGRIGGENSAECGVTMTLSKCNFLARHCKGWAPQGDFAIDHCKDIVGLGTAGICCHGHFRNPAGLGTAGILCCWALQDYSAAVVDHKKTVP